jgi:hypothetical protein
LCSPATDARGGGDPIIDGLVVIPFDWELVDAYHLMDRFADLRVHRGDSRAPLSAEAAGQRMAATLGATTGERTVIMHPFLMLDAAWRGQVQRLLTTLEALGGVVAGGE